MLAVLVKEISVSAGRSVGMSMEPPPFVQVLDDLIKGREFATQLQGLLRESPEAGRIMDQILHTFSRAIDAAKAGAGAGAGDGSEVQSGVTYGGGKRKAVAGGGDGRGPCRRRTQQSSGNTVTMKNVHDGQPWRKYGQKEIQNSKYPKSYFRCTHKYDQQCAAQRQVQRCDENPDEFRITYIGAHTCRDPVAGVVPHGVQYHQSCGGMDAGSRLISFGPKAGAAAPATTTSTTTTTTITTNTVNANGQAGKADAAIRSGLQRLKKEAGGEQEEVLSNLTPGSSAARGTPAAGGPDQGDVTSTLQRSYAGGPDMGEYFGVDDFLDLDFDDSFRF